MQTHRSPSRVSLVGGSGSRIEIEASLEDEAVNETSNSLEPLHATDGARRIRLNTCGPEMANLRPCRHLLRPIEGWLTSSPLHKGRPQKRLSSASSIYMKTIQEKSKTLARWLRHRPDAIGLTLDKNGWVDIAELIEKAAASGTLFTREELMRPKERSVALPENLL